MVQIEQLIHHLPYAPLAVLGLFLLIQLYYIFSVYGKLASYPVHPRRSDERQPPISIIICANNEQENLQAFLPSIMEQDYPDFEVVVVNDCSEDETACVLNNFKNKYPDKFKIVEIKEYIRLKHTKKYAVTMGIKAAKNDYLVFTDADCQPNSNLWLAEMAGAFAGETEIVLGYSPYFKQKGFLNKLIRFETTHTAMSYLAYALKKDAYMGVGRNMAYTKELFFRGKGFNKHIHIKSGDDDLFVNQNATSRNVRIAISPEAHMFSVPKDTWKSYYRQKARHSGASVLYKGRHKRMLATQLISALLFYVLLIPCLILYPNLWYIPVGIYVLRLISQLLVFNKVYEKLQVKDLLFWVPLLDLTYYFYICTNGIFNRSKKHQAWK